MLATPSAVFALALSSGLLLIPIAIISQIRRPLLSLCFSVVLCLCCVGVLSDFRVRLLRLCPVVKRVRATTPRLVEGVTLPVGGSSGTVRFEMFV